MLNENRFLDTFRGHNIRPIYQSTRCVTQTNKSRKTSEKLHTR